MTQNDEDLIEGLVLRVRSLGGGIPGIVKYQGTDITRACDFSLVSSSLISPTNIFPPTSAQLQLAITTSKMASILSTPACLSQLPTELCRMVISFLIQGGCRVASLAAVSRKWQNIVEPYTFARIMLTPSRCLNDLCLAPLAFTHGRILHAVIHHFQRIFLLGFG